MPKEIETKFKIESPRKVKYKLKKIGGKFIYRRFEKDIYYKAPGNPPLKVIRLRQTGGKSIFTVKTAPGVKLSKTFKIRDEFETEISDTKTFIVMLDRLGFRPWFKKEKLREVYKYDGATICIDKLPFMGFFIEIEAPVKKIKKAARLLGIQMKNAVPHTYSKLFDMYKKRHGKPYLKLEF